MVNSLLQEKPPLLHVRRKVSSAPFHSSLYALTSVNFASHIIHPPMLEVEGKVEASEKKRKGGGVLHSMEQL